MVTPVIHLPADRLAGTRPARAEPRPAAREAGTGAVDPFELADQPDRRGAVVTRLDDHAGQRRAARRAEAEHGRAATLRPADFQFVAPAGFPDPHQAEAAERIARLDGRTASLTFQAQMLAQEVPDPAAPGPTGKNLQTRHLAEAASAAYRRRQGEPDRAPLIEPHRPIDLVL